MTSTQFPLPTAISDPAANRRLGIISCIPAALDAAGRLVCDHATGRLYDEILRQIPGTLLCVPLLAAPVAGQTYQLGFPSASITYLPPLASVVRSQRYATATRATLRKFADSVDYLFVRVPFQIPAALCNLGKPKVMHVISNPRQIIDASNDYRGPIKWLARCHAAYTERAMRRMAAEPATRVVSNGQQMFEILAARAGRVVVSSGLYEHEMQSRPDSRLSDPPRLLFVGYLRPEKGIHTLLDAFEAVRAKRPLKLSLVGGVDKVTTRVEADVRARIAASRFRDDIQRCGTVEFGPALFELYRTHDLFILPSLSEGTPRTLIEARAMGCPAIATNVGGIPNSVLHGRDGWLIEPNRPDQLVAAIERILDDEPLRLSLRDGGMARARRHSLERFAGELVEELHLAAATCGQERRMNQPLANPIAAAGAASAPSSEPWPLVSIVMPIYNEGPFIAQSLDRLLAQDYPADKLQIIVADGMSQDNTRTIVAEYCQRDQRIVMVDNPTRFRAAGLNLAIAAAAGEIVICVDGHGETAPDFVRQNVALLQEHPEAWSVGGPYQPSGEGAFGKAVAIAMSHPCGVGVNTHRFPKYEGYAEGVPFPAFRRWVFDRVGWFDERLVRTEDDEFNYRITQAGGKIFISPRVRYDYFVRNSPRKLFQQYVQYSFWRIPVLKKHKRPATFRQLIPPLFYLATIVLAIVGVVLRQPVIALALPLVYLGTLLLVGLGLVPRIGCRVACLVPVAMLIMHASYAWGIVYGWLAAVFFPSAWEPAGSMSQQRR